MIKDYNKTAIITAKRDISYSELLRRISLFATVTPKGHDTKTIIISENREGWIYAFFAVWANRGIAVPVDASSTVSDIAYIIRDCTPDSVWTSQDKAEDVRAAITQTGINVGINIIDEYENATLSTEKANIEYNDSDTAIIIYTSGTTGSPKGVMLSFANLNANIRSVSDEVPIFNTERRTIILLPLHHVLPLVGTVIAPITRGGGVAICPSMSGPDIMDTLCRGKIAIFVGVPRLWQTLYSGIKKKIDASLITRMLFALCKKVGSRTLSRIIFSSVRKKMGGHIYCFVSGGAALDKEIGEGFKTLGLDVLEGYGMTETAPIIAFTRPGDIVPGCVGLPLPSVECKLIDGELCAKGPNVMQGYYNRPEETAAVIDKDGFIHTGDLARFDNNGRVYITGRIKEIIVLSNGKNVQPSEIEYKLEKYTSMVKEAAVTQDGNMLKAIIVPQPEWANGMTDSQIEEELKRKVIEPYNLSVTNYKKIMSIFVTHEDLPRTKLDKIQRFKLKDIISGAAVNQQQPAADETPEPELEEYRILKKYIEEEKKIAVRPTDHIETDLALDSLDRVGLQGFIEQSFGMEIKADAMLQFKNVLEIAEQIAKGKTHTDVEKTDWNTLLNNSSNQLRLPNPSVLYPILAKTFKLLFRLYFRLTVKGTENIPANGPFILAPNHQSFIDGPLTMSGMQWNAIYNYYFYVKEAHVQNPFVKWVAERVNIILMQHSNLKNSIMMLGEVLKQGKNVVIFPEGTRCRNGKTGNFKKTFAILSKELNVPIVPVRISGAYDALPYGSILPKPHKITIEYLPAVQPDESMTYNQLSDKVKAVIENREA